MYEQLPVFSPREWKEAIVYARSLLSNLLKYILFKFLLPTIHQKKYFKMVAKYLIVCSKKTIFIWIVVVRKNIAQSSMIDLLLWEMQSTFLGLYFLLNREKTITIE